MIIHVVQYTTYKYISVPIVGYSKREEAESVVTELNRKHEDKTFYIHEMMVDPTKDQMDFILGRN